MPGSIQTIDLSWKNTRILNCTFCGRMIARKYWEDQEFPDERFCEEACADVKRSLAVPKNEERPS